MSAEVAYEAWTRGSALRGPLLGLLLHQERPISAYRLSGLLVQRLPAWHVTPSSVANLLKRLLEEGYVSLGPGSTRAYVATEKAKLALEEWMASPLCRQSVREELHARIASSSPRHAALVYRALDAYERECFDILADSGEPSAASAPLGSWRSLTINLTRAAADESLHANIRWSKIARRWIKDWVEESRGQGRTL
jgi:DNA-binding PadR family transcriptional regulator